MHLHALHYKMDFQIDVLALSMFNLRALITEPFARYELLPVTDSIKGKCITNGLSRSRDMCNLSKSVFQGKRFIRILHKKWTLGFLHIFYSKLI